MSADLSTLGGLPAIPSQFVRYYVVIENRRFGSVEAMCRFLKVRPADVAPYFDNARFHGSEMVVIDSLSLGEPDRQIRAVVIQQPGGAVILCGGLFGDMHEDRAAADAMAEEFLEHPDYADRFVCIGEFRAATYCGRA